LEGLNFWEVFEYDPGPWCEYERTASFLREPANSLSDFTFFALGLYMLRTGLVTLVDGAQTNNLLTDFPLLTLLNGAVNLIHAVGTFTNHACRCNPGHRWDVTGMCMTALWLVCYNICRIIALKLNYKARDNALSRNSMAQVILAVYGVLFVPGSILLYKLSDLPYSNHGWELRETSMLASLIISSLILVASYYFLTKGLPNVQLDYRFLGLSVQFLLLGVMCHKIDVHQLLCWPHSPLQFHACWHALTCSSLFFVFWHLLSEHWTTDTVKKL